MKCSTTISARKPPTATTAGVAERHQASLDGSNPQNAFYHQDTKA